MSSEREYPQTGRGDIVARGIAKEKKRRGKERAFEL